MDGRVGGYLQMDALWRQGRWGSRNLGNFADVIYLRSHRSLDLQGISETFFFKLTTWAADREKLPCHFNFTQISSITLMSSVFFKPSLVCFWITPQIFNFFHPKKKRNGKLLAWSIQWLNWIDTQTKWKGRKNNVANMILFNILQ